MLSTSPIKEEPQSAPPIQTELAGLADQSQSEIAFQVIELARLLLMHEPELAHSCLRLLESLQSIHPVLRSLAGQLLDLLEHHARTPEPSAQKSDPLFGLDQNESELSEWATEGEIWEERSQIFGEAIEEDLFVTAWPRLGGER